MKIIPKKRTFDLSFNIHRVTEPQETIQLDETDIRKFAQELKTELSKWDFWKPKNGDKQLSYDWIIDDVLDYYINNTDNSLDKL